MDEFLEEFNSQPMVHKEPDSARAQYFSGGFYPSGLPGREAVLVGDVTGTFFFFYIYIYIFFF